jgi:drug/metabolite transporter (DMT)-like permease
MLIKLDQTGPFFKESSVSRLQADLVVLLAAVIWGVAFYFQKIAMLHLGPSLFVGLRALVAALVLVPFAFIESRNAAATASQVWMYSLAGGLVFFGGAFLQQEGLITATVTNTGFLTALYVVFTPFLLWLIRGEKPGYRIWLATGVAFAGIWLLGGGTLASFSHGDILIAGSAVFWSLYMVIASQSGKFARPILFTCLTFCTLAMIALPFASIFEQVSWNGIRQAAVPILYVGILSSALTYAMLAIAVRYVPASRVSVLLSTETLFSALTANLMLGERLPAVGWMGAALVLVAVLIVQSIGQTQVAQDQSHPA